MNLATGSGNVYENPMAEALKAMALAGHGLAWLPESAVRQELADGRLIEVGGGGPPDFLRYPAVSLAGESPPVGLAVFGTMSATLTE